jgi:transcriptional regulator with XRE-family HTH domain
MRGGDRRRTPGLRRAEVAVLAGVSTDYYARLEQGRERHPSAQVLSALARVFQLDPDATEHLHELAHPREGKRRRAGGFDQVNADVVRFVEGCDHVLAFVVNRRLDVLARNPVAIAFFKGFEHTDNMMRLVFLNPAAREFYLDWEQEAWYMVAHLHSLAGVDSDDPSLIELVEELSLGSEAFRQMWPRHDVRARTRECVRFHHRDVGEMTLHAETFSINSAPGVLLVVAQAEPGSPSQEALAKLGTLC